MDFPVKNWVISIPSHVTVVYQRVCQPSSRAFTFHERHADSVEHFLLWFGFGSGSANNLFFLKGRERDKEIHTFEQWSKLLVWVIQGIILYPVIYLYIYNFISHFLVGKGWVFHWKKAGGLNRGHWMGPNLGGLNKQQMLMVEFWRISFIV